MVFLQNVILAHDKIVKFGLDDPLKAIMSEAEEKEYLSKRASHYGDISIKVVKINKSSEPLVSFKLFTRTKNHL